MEQKIPSDLVPAEEAAAKIGVSMNTFRKRVEEGRIVSYQDGRDRRRRLFSIADLERSTRPIRLDQLEKAS